MKYDPIFHHKHMLLRNISVLSNLCKNSEEFQTSELAYDMDILNVTINEAGWKAVHVLATNSDKWLTDKVANDYNILNIAVDNKDTVAHFLAHYQKKWLQFNSAHDPEILKIKGNKDRTVAHSLAEYQPLWLDYPSSKDKSILAYKDIFGVSVAYYLAQYQPNWLLSQESKDRDIITMGDTEGWTVASALATFQEDWCFTDEANDKSILTLKNNMGKAVAFHLLGHENCLSIENLWSKEILSLEHKEKMLAEHLLDRYKNDFSKKTFCIDENERPLSISSMACHLISQGAAFKLSQIISLMDAQSIFDESSLKIQDINEPVIALKIAIALYSTIDLSFAKITELVSLGRLNNDEKFIAYGELLKKCEEVISELVNKNTELLSYDLPVDIHCEKGNEIFIKKCSENLFLRNIHSDDIKIEDVPSKPMIY